MADATYLSQLVRPLDKDDALSRAFHAAFDGAITFGRPLGQSTNHALIFLEGRTHETANTEFSIQHGLNRVPYALHLQSLPLDGNGSIGFSIVPLTVTRAADAQRIYLSSSVEDARIRVGVEV